LALEVAADTTLGPGFAAWTGRQGPAAGEVFLHDTRELGGAGRPMVALLNRMALYTWGGLVGALEAGATGADLTLLGGPMDETAAEALRDALNDLDGPLLLEEVLNPETGRAPGRDPRQRQLLRLTGEAETRFDPVAGAWMVRIAWRPEDALTSRFCFVTRCPDEPTEEAVSLFFGNLLPATHGAPNLTLLTDPDRPLDTALATALVAERTAFLADHPMGRITEAHYEETKWGRVCPLTESPLAYRDTPPGGEVPVRSSLSVAVEGIAGWQEQSDLTQSREDAEHFLVETSENGQSQVRFGNGVNGTAPPPGTYVAARYQTGIGSAGNVGADRLASFDEATFTIITRVWNPFDVTNGRAPESPEIIRRRVPEAYRARQQRAITLADYVKRAEELPFVQRAAAAYGWTGSWRTVRITLDPLGATDLLPEQVAEALAHLNPVRLIGEDIEIRPPDLLPLDIRLTVCAHPRFWPEDLELELEEAFTEGYTSTGQRGFFHPDNWTFGQKLHASQIVGRALQIEGVDRVLKLRMAPWDQAGGPTTETITLTENQAKPAENAAICPAPNQILRVANDPSALELGRMQIFVEGGRR
ncbi:MAG: baseplate J/gp47 family protein, partial [Pseudomonadota bacterium]